MANAAHAARPIRRPWTATALPALSLATVLAVTGCSVPGIPGPTGAPGAATPAPAQQAAAITPLEPVTTDQPTPSPQPSTKPTPAPATTPAPAPAPAPVVITNDLATGSVSHALGAAGNHLIVDYWTTGNTSMWTSESSPIIQLSAKVAGTVENKIIKITRFNARVDALAAVLANDTGDFAIGDPDSYSSAVLVPAHPGATNTRIVFTFDLLTETAPGTGVFTRQTVMDSLTIGYPATPAPARN
jgi:hypothetical protein